MNVLPALLITLHLAFSPHYGCLGVNPELKTNGNVGETLNALKEYREKWQKEEK